MSEELNNNRPAANEDDGIDIVALILKYLAYWKWFAASVVVCVVLAFVYVRFKTPVYSIDAAMLVKEQDKKSNTASGLLSSMQDIGMFSLTNNFDNEVEILQSRSLVKKVVIDLGLYISVSQRRLLGYNIPLYKQTPVKVYITPEEADRLEGGVQMNLKYTVDGRLDVDMEYILNEEEEDLEASFDKLPAVLPTPVGVFSFTRNDSVPPIEETTRLKVYVGSPTRVTESYVKNLTVEATSKTTTIASIEVENSVKQRGVDFINNLVLQYNQDANDEKNEVAQKSAEFIDERIEIINRELGSTETELADFKERSGLTDLTSDASLALQERTQYERQLSDNATQIRLVQFLSQYVNDPTNADEVIPVNIGITDNGLNTMIDQYNNMIIERKRLLRTSSENNPAVVNLNTGIEAMRGNVLTSINSVLNGLEIKKADIQRQANKFESRVGNVPKQEKEFLTISRQQEIKATLYLMLLQKREENAITLASTANNGRIIKTPLPGIDPVSPRKMLILLAAFVVGLCIPAGIIYLIDLMKYKIESAADVATLTSVPILGEIPTAPQLPVKGSIVVHENKNGIMEEAFRGLRTNIMFMLEKEQRVIMFTSTQAGEGKSFIAGNLALSMAYLGRKVIIVGLDIRKPGLNITFGLPKRAHGITDYLSDPQGMKLEDVIVPSEISPNLDILPGGTIPPNPAELLVRPILDEVINKLREMYEYVIIDSAPITMVTDTSIASRVADMGVYVCRANYTIKDDYRYINALADQKKFAKLGTLVNGVEYSTSKGYGRYGYGYGRYGYGYGRYGYGYGRYGYGYGYGYGDANDNADHKKSGKSRFPKLGKSGKSKKDGKA